MKISWDELIERSLECAVDNQAYFSYMVLDIKDFLQEDSDQWETVACAEKLLMYLIANDLIVVYDVYDPEFKILDLPPQQILHYLMGKWEAINWRDPFDHEIMWYELSERGHLVWNSK